MRKEQQAKRAIPQKLKKKSEWILNRRAFIMTSAVGTLACQLPFGKATGQPAKPGSILSNEQKKIVASIQQILFPEDGNGPSASEIHALEYLQWVISDKEKDPEETAYLLDGIGWVNETAEEEYGKGYVMLSSQEREELVAFVAKKSWGESWLSVILSLIIEALMCDPKYGGNTNEAGWKWLDHNPGQPRPSEDLLYPAILSFKEKAE